MKNLIILLGICFCFFDLSAQVDYETYRKDMLQRVLQQYPDQGDNIYLNIELPDNLGITKEAANQLEGKCRSIATINGVSSLSMSDRFYLTCKIDILEKGIIEGMPVRVSEKVRFRFIVCDIVEAKAFEELSIEGSGIGTNETKAMVSCIKNIHPKDHEFSVFIQNAKKKIVDYYTQRGPQIITDASALAATGDVNQAIAMLINVPSVCPYYQKCRARAIEIYLDDIDGQAGELYNSARALWSSSPNQAGADGATALLEQMPAISRYSNLAKELDKEIHDRITYLDKRDWDFKMEQYRDSMRLKMAEMYPPKKSSSGGSSTTKSSSSNSSGTSDSDAGWLCAGMLTCGIIGAAICSALCPPAAPVFLLL